MKTSTQATYLINRFGIKKGLDLLKEAGYKYVDYSMFCLFHDGNFDDGSYLEIVRNTKAYADKIGIGICQTHAPFPTYIDSDDAYNSRLLDILIKSIEVTSLLGVEYMVLHPLESEENQKQKNIVLFDKLTPYAKKYNVKIAIENLLVVCHYADEVNDYLGELDDEVYCICLDVGHCGQVGVDCIEMIHSIGSKNLKALHIQDNDGKSDFHTIPFSFNVDFHGIVKALKEIGYDGYLNLEADSFLLNFPDELIPDAVKLMHKTVDYLAQIYDKY